jgi:DNA-binding CsgD family transcriptional regulator
MMHKNIGPENVLTRREVEIARLASEGLRLKQIAYRLRISEGDTSRLLESIYRKLGLTGPPPDAA